MKTKLTMIALILLGTGAFAQKNVMNEGDMIFNLGLGLADTYLGAGYGFVPGINLSGEIGMFPTSDIGIVSLGGIIALKTAPYSSNLTTGSYFGTAVQFRGAWHLSYWDNPDFDVYAGLGAGLRFNSKTEENDITGTTKTSSVDPTTSFFVGGRWMMKDNFGFFGELGFDALSVAKIGVTYKL